MRAPFRTQVLGLLAAGAVSVAAGCAAGDDTAAGATPGGGGTQGAIPVTTAVVMQKSMPVEIRVIGSAEPYASVAIRSQITGQLIAVNFREGEDVRQGQVLFSLDRRPLESALQQAAANLDRDLAQARNAEVQSKRFQDLVDRGIAPREQLDTWRTSALALNATVEANRA